MDKLRVSFLVRSKFLATFVYMQERKTRTLKSQITLTLSKGALRELFQSLCDASQLAFCALAAS